MTTFIFGSDYYQSSTGLTVSGSKFPGTVVPSFEQKQYGNVHVDVSHRVAKSCGVSVVGAGAINQTKEKRKMYS